MKNHRTIRYCIGIVITVFLAWNMTGGTASAQFGGTRSTWFPQNNPSAMSPWLELKRATTSELDSYHQYVRPRLEMEQLLQAQRREISRQQDRQQMMQKEISQVMNFQQTQDYQLQIEVTATGKGATYGNYLNYYPRKK